MRATKRIDFTFDFVYLSFIPFQSCWKQRTSKTIFTETAHSNTTNARLLHCDVFLTLFLILLQNYNVGFRILSDREIAFENLRWQIAKSL